MPGLFAFGKKARASRWTLTGSRVTQGATSPRENPMRKLTLTMAAAGVVALTFGTLHAQQGGPPQLPGQMDTSRAQAGTYAADVNHSLIGWRVNHFGFNDYFGIFGNVSGTLTIDPAAPQNAKVDITIPV